MSTKTELLAALMKQSAPVAGVISSVNKVAGEAVENFFHIPVPGRYGDRAIEVVKNPTTSDYARLNKEVRSEFPELMPGEPKTRFTIDDNGDKYIWKAHEAAHFQMEPGISEKIGLGVNQNNTEKIAYGVAPAAVGLGALAASDDSEAGVISKGGRKLIEAWHGSPHKFDKFSMDNVGTGEGAQAYGHGLYFADSEDVAKGYRDDLAATLSQQHTLDGEDIPAWIVEEVDAGRVGKVRADFEGRIAEANAKLANPDTIQPWNIEAQKATAEKTLRQLDAIESGATTAPPGALYRAHLDVDPDTLLDWDKPLSEQSEAVQEALSNIGITAKPKPKKATLIDNLDGEYAIQFPAGHVSNNYADKAQAEGALRRWNEMTERSFKAKDKHGFEVAQGIDGTQAEKAQVLRDAGIPGIRYKDGMSRGADGGTSNYVMFDDKPISIVERGFADPRLLAGTAGATGLMAKLIRDSQDDSTVRAPKNPKTAMLATMLRDGERAVKGSPAEFVYPSGLAPWLERLAYNEDPSKLETAMAIADFLP